MAFPTICFPYGGRNSVLQIHAQGRRRSARAPHHDLVFEPLEKELCIHVGGGENPCADRQWKGEAWIDAEEFQPVRIETQLAQGVPWGIRVFLGTNVRQLGSPSTINAPPRTLVPRHLRHGVRARSVLVVQAHHRAAPEHQRDLDHSVPRASVVCGARFSVQRRHSCRRPLPPLH